MKYIEKHLEAKEVLEYEAELEENDLDKRSLSDALVHPSMRGPDVYDVVKSFRSFNGLKERLFADKVVSVAIVVATCVIRLIHNMWWSMFFPRRKIVPLLVSMRIFYCLAGLQKRRSVRE